jgi:transketolase
MREVFPKFIEDYLIKDKKIFVLLGDIGVHSFRNVFNNFEKNILNIGILEQTMVGFSAGLAIEGKIPFVHTIAPFIVNRAYEQIKVDLCYQNLNVNLVSVGASLDYAALGSTHHCPEDVAILSKLPNIKIYCPGNAVEFYNLLKNYSLPGPKYFRITGSSHKLKLNIKNNAAILKKGKKGTIVVVGNALRFIDEYYQELDANIIYLNCVKPINQQVLIDNFNENLIIIQDFYIGSITSEIINIYKNKKLKIFEIGLPNKFFLNYGSAQQHYTYLQLDKKIIKKKILKVLRN